MIVQPRFAPVRDVFQALFDEGLELGARFCVVIDNQAVVDLWGGYADRAQTLPFDDQTLTAIYSTTKALAALMIARLVEQGRLDYRQTVASVWPEFGAAGKADITVEQALSHQGGLAGFLEKMDPDLWYDWTAICDKLATMAPMWPPGSASGYHAVTYGYLAGEIFRRVDGRTMGVALRQDLADPLGLDLWIGLPASEDARVAEVERPKAFPDFGQINDATRAAFLTRWASPRGGSDELWRRMEVPSANGQATALALARLMGAVAAGGDLDGVHVLGPAARDAMSALRIHGQDLVLPYVMSWGAGVMRNADTGAFGPGANTFGHSGWGGSCAFCDPDQRMGAAYVMNRQGNVLMGDPRVKRLTAALYGCL